MDNGFTCHKSALYNVAWVVGAHSSNSSFHRHLILHAQAHDGPYGNGWRWRWIWQHAGCWWRNQLYLYSLWPQIQGRSVPTLRKQNAPGRLLTHDSRRAAPEGIFSKYNRCVDSIQRGAWMGLVQYWCLSILQKFPLCVKESGGTYERGKDKAQFLDHLSKISSDDAAAYTVKLTCETIGAIRLFTN